MIQQSFSERLLERVIVTSGGYPPHSHVLVAELAQRVIERVGHGYRGQGSESRSR
jgi:hypothetical protein